MTAIATDVDTSPTPPLPRRRSRLRRRNSLIGWSFILPNFLGFALLTLIPVVTLFYLGFTNWNIFGTANWTGLANFQRLLGDTTFHTAVLNTFYYAILHIPLTFVVSLGLALLLNTKLRGVAFFRTAAFFPYITSIVAIAVVWNLLFSPQYGPINQLLHFVGIANPPTWLQSTTWALPATVIVSTWRDMGYYMVLFLAGLQTVPRELHEAARVDGASVWQRFWNVTMPCLRPTTFFVTVMLTINSFKVFDLILVMTNGGPGNATLVLSQFIYQTAFVQNQFGYASAASIVLFLICIVVTIIQFLINKRRSA
ncbi:MULTISPECIES: sugar ABC transporter permease [unclassified Leifsonia]|jgi:multiple sugar transport system permease protein/alpha-1,4-digalacturonate transport system permease protein|uniref:carbohydrate ABC transporter permease n=1 Tax=unclassified Leifsonia TaxID=2663824 RepID=UPI0008A7C60C|nr:MULTISPECIES: sugar ABC transporter permease [unclassified Leifsonia]SEI11340.1 carbohydrate ABC transporter membrane protein 1, CUT1 family [Leifsonia sp. CL154]SFL88672.1 carbohydrate ABC transporter membrane protein 1, CUT1 family [Leifsonia sp. CL147]